MTSWEFAEEYPRLTEEQTEWLVKDHDLDPAEALKNLGPEKFTITAERIGWPGD